MEELPLFLSYSRIIAGGSKGKFRERHSFLLRNAEFIFYRLFLELSVTLAERGVPSFKIIDPPLHPLIDWSRSWFITNVEDSFNSRNCDDILYTLSTGAVISTRMSQHYHQQSFPFVMALVHIKALTSTELQQWHWKNYLMILEIVL